MAVHLAWMRAAHLVRYLAQVELVHSLEELVHSLKELVHSLEEELVHSLMGTCRTTQGMPGCLSAHQEHCPVCVRSAKPAVVALVAVSIRGFGWAVAMSK